MWGMGDLPFAMGFLLFGLWAHLLAMESWGMEGGYHARKSAVQRPNQEKLHSRKAPQNQADDTNHKTIPIDNGQLTIDN
jgi:hypothetical protein